MSTVPSPAPPKRRLVPDRSDTIEVGGSRLVRAVRAPAAEETPSPEPRSIDDVVQKHLSREVAEVAEAHPEFLEALAAAADDAPAPLHDLAGRIELFTDGEEAVPSLEPDGKKREGMTISPVIATDDAPPDFVSPRAAPQTLIDLFSLFPMLDGVSQYIYVERKEPKLFSGRKVAGILRPITGPITLAEWQEIYGGGTYKLIVYGPPKRGGMMNPDGRVAPKALTEPMTVTFPGIPSFEGEVYDDDEAADMTQSTMHGFPNRRGPASSADAAVVKTQVEADLEREKRRDTKEDRQREREEQDRKDRDREQTTVAKQIAEMGRAAADREAEFRRELLELQRQHQSDLQDQRKEFEEKLEKKKPERSELDTALALSKNLQGDPGASSAALEALRADHAREIDRLARLSKEDNERAERRIHDERERSDRVIKEAEARADARIREAVERTGNLERDLRERADREMQRVKDEADRRVTDLQHQHTTAMASEARSHDRDLASLKAQHQMAIESLKASYEGRLETARSEVKRTASDVERYKQIAEDNEDVVGKITKLKDSAAALGMIDAAEAGSSEPETIGQMLMKMGTGLVSNFPAIIENVSTMVKQRSAQDLQAARQAGRNEMVAAASEGLAAPGLPPAHRRRGLDGGGGWVPRHMSEVGPAPVTPGHDPFVVMPEPEYVAPVPQPQPQYQPVPQQQQVFPVAMPPAPQMRPVSQPPPQAQPMLGPASPSVPPPPPASPPASMPPTAPPQQSAPSPADQAALAEDREILQAEQMLLPPYQNNMTVPLLAEAMVQQVPIETLRDLLQSTDADRVMLAIARSGDPNSPFLRRDGKKYLRALFDELKKRLAS